MINYQINILDTSGNKLAVIDDFKGMQYAHRLNNPGNTTLAIDGGSIKRELFDLDCFVEVWRSDYENGIEWYCEKRTFHRSAQRAVHSAGARVFTSYGRGLLDLLSRRVIAYPAGLSQTSKSGPAETVLKEFVDENAGPSATILNGRALDGVMTGLTIEADSGAGDTWEGDRAWKYLLSVIQEIAEATNMYFDIVYTGAAQFEFRTYEGQLGSDRTATGVDTSTGKNSAGNDPVVFSVSGGSISEGSTTASRLEEKNACIVLGRGEGKDRSVKVLTLPDDIDDSPWNQCEMTLNSSSETTDDALESSGLAALAENQQRSSFWFVPQQIPGLLYGRDYFFGDKITANIDGVIRNVMITSVQIGVGDDGENISYELETV